METRGESHWYGDVEGQEVIGTRRRHRGEDGESESGSELKGRVYQGRVAAVVAAYTADLRARLASFDRHRTPKARLKALVRDMADQREVAAQYGCPMGTLCSELDKRDDDLERAAAELLTLSVDWVEQQFRSMGRSDARDLAVALVAANQGISLLTNTLRDPDLMARESRRLDRWIDSLARVRPGGNPRGAGVGQGL
jgi:TetR/AcrR family transcriptional repressor of nem operon